LDCHKHNNISPGSSILPRKGGLAAEMLGRYVYDNQAALFGKENMEQNITKTNDTRLISIPEACKWLGIGHWAVYQQINKRALKTVKIGKRRLVSIRALNEFVASMEQ